MAAEKHRTVSAGLMREHGMRLEKTRKSLPAVARLRAATVPELAFRPTRKRQAAPPPDVDASPPTPDHPMSLDRGIRVNRPDA